ARAKAQAAEQSQNQQGLYHQKHQHQNQHQQWTLEEATPGDCRADSRDSITHGSSVSYFEQPGDSAASLIAEVPPMPRTDLDAVNEAFVRLTANTSSGSLAGASMLASYPDIRRISTHSNEAARQHAAEARASLLAAGAAERSAEADLARSSSNGNYSAYSPTVYSPSPRNTFGYRDGLTSQQQQQKQVYQRQQQQLPAGAGNGGGGGHAKGDSLTIGDDIYAIINEFSVVADSRYGEVDARSLKKRELGNSRTSSRYAPSNSPSMSLNYHGMPSPGGSSGGIRRSPGQSVAHMHYHQSGSSNGPAIQSSSTVAQDADSGDSDTAWIRSALRMSGDSPDIIANTASLSKKLANGSGPIDSTLPKRYYPQSASDTDRFGQSSPMSKRQSLVQRPPDTARNASPSPYLPTNVSPSSAHVHGSNASDDFSNKAGAVQAVYKRESDTNMSVNSTKTSLNDAGGRHTAARARAWAARQKDRMLHAFTGDRSQRKPQAPSPYKPLGASKLSSETPILVDSHIALEPPPQFSFHHQSQSAVNVVVSMRQHIERPLSAD
ncbi:hypothetical protein GGI22_006554, partial [Coemansia erecta]